MDLREQIALVISGANVRRWQSGPSENQTPFLEAADRILALSRIKAGLALLDVREAELSRE